MAYILFFFLIILFIILFVLGAGLSLIRGILGLLFGTKKSGNNNTNSCNSFDNEDQDNSQAKSHNGDKVFTKDEGEYVDFEEVKDDNPK